MALLISLLGAESTGKSDLAHDLAQRLERQGWVAPGGIAVVDEYLREFCAARGRTPSRDEQVHIADEQTRRIAAALARHDVVFADTTALMTAVYSDFVFTDRSLYEPAARAHGRSDLTLVTALDLPWTPDGIQRDGPHVREPVDALLRAALQRHGIEFGVVAGHDGARVDTAWSSVSRVLRPDLDDAAGADDVDAPGGRRRRWAWICERCGDPACERDDHPTWRGDDARR